MSYTLKVFNVCNTYVCSCSSPSFFSPSFSSPANSSHPTQVGTSADRKERRVLWEGREGGGEGKDGKVWKKRKHLLNCWLRCCVHGGYRVVVNVQVIVVEVTVIQAPHYETNSHRSGAHTFGEQNVFSPLLNCPVDTLGCWSENGRLFHIAVLLF